MEESFLETMIQGAYSGEKWLNQGVERENAGVRAQRGRYPVTLLPALFIQWNH